MIAQNKYFILVQWLTAWLIHYLLPL